MIRPQQQMSLVGTTACLILRAILLLIFGSLLIFCDCLFLSLVVTSNLIQHLCYVTLFCHWHPKDAIICNKLISADAPTWLILTALSAWTSLAAEKINVWFFFALMSYFQCVPWVATLWTRQLIKKVTWLFSLTTDFLSMHKRLKEPNAKSFSAGH